MQSSYYSNRFSNLKGKRKSLNVDMSTEMMSENFNGGERTLRSNFYDLSQ